MSISFGAEIIPVFIFVPMSTLIAFLLLSSYIFQTNSLTSLKCLGKQLSLSFSERQSCAFKLSKGDPFPTDEQLEQSPFSCDMVAVNAVMKNNDEDGFCFGEVLLIGHGGKKEFNFLNISKEVLKSSSFIDTMGDTSNHNELVQYAGVLSFENNISAVALRVKCKTEDNCAWKIMKDLLGEIPHIDFQRKVFAQLKHMLYNPKPNQNTKLR